MNAIRPHPGISHATSQQATSIPDMATRDRTPPADDRRLWTGTELIARIRNTPDHQTVRQANP